jgi:hypothetical protein
MQNREERDERAERDRRPERNEQPATTGEMTTNEYRRENQQGSVQVESAEIQAAQSERGQAQTPPNGVDAETQSGRTPGSPMDPEGLETNRSGAEIRDQMQEQQRQTPAAGNVTNFERRDDRSASNSDAGQQRQAQAASAAPKAERRDNRAGMTGDTDADNVVSLFPSNDAEEFRSRWDSIQTGFVDEPRQAVEQADHLVDEAMKKLSSTFTDERAGLERQWSQGDDVSTEDLRMALRKYRTFFDRLLAA